MKFLKRLTITLLIGMLLLVLLRGSLYRTCVKYTETGTRKSIVINNPQLITIIEQAKKKTGKEQLTINEIIAMARKISNQHLQFSMGKVANNPNKLIGTGKANCIGYSAMFNAIVTYLIQEQGDSQKYKTRHLFGKLKLLNVDLHSIVNHPFLRDHDYNEIIVVATGEKIYVDPSVSDYLYIHQVSSEE